MNTDTEIILRQNLRFQDSRYLHELNRLERNYEENRLDIPLFLKQRIAFVRVKAREARKLARPAEPDYISKWKVR